MKNKHKYDLIFSGLTSDNHQFEYVIDNRFFDFFEESAIKKGNLNVEVNLNKKDSILILDFFIDGYVQLPCDRCLAEFKQKIKTHERLFVKFGHEATDITDVDDTMVLPFEASQIDLRQHLYDYINTALPIRWLHPEDEEGNLTCDPEAIEILEKYMAKDEEKQEDKIDPRWNKLQDLMNN